MWFPDPRWFLLALALLAGCGFQLRGSDVGSLGAVSLPGRDASAETGRIVRRQLDLYGVAVVSPGPDIPAVRLLGERSMRRSVATSAGISAAAYELTLELDVSISLNDEALLDRATLIAVRTYEVDADNLSGSLEEQTLLLAEMRRELADKLIRRLEAVAI